MMTILKIICSYCKVDMGEKDGEGVEGISHSICPPCYKKVMGKELLDTNQQLTEESL